MNDLHKLSQARSQEGERERPFFSMSKAHGYFGVEAGDVNLYAIPIPKCDL